MVCLIISIPLPTSSHATNIPIYDQDSTTLYLRVESHILSQGGSHKQPHPPSEGIRT